MKTQTQQVRPWLWPDHVISKRASGLLREEHNAVVNSHAELLEALRQATEALALVDDFSTATGGAHPDMQNDALDAAHAAIAKVAGAE